MSKEQIVMAAQAELGILWFTLSDISRKAFNRSGMSTFPYLKDRSGSGVENAVERAEGRGRDS